MNRVIQLLVLLFVLYMPSNVLGQQKTLYDFKVKDIDDKNFNLASLKGKKVLIVNVASKCGFTPQYEELEKLYKKYKDKGFTVIAFPCNDFKGQEPGTNAEIKEFCTLNYGVSFPVMAKVTVKQPHKSAIYKWLTEKSENGVLNAEVEWNFQKFMIDQNGKVVGFALPKESPLSDKIIDWIEQK